METLDGEPFANRLRRLRREQGLTQQELADRSGISVRAISDLEREINLRPRRDTAGMLADGLGLTGPARASFLDTARRWRAVSFGDVASELPVAAGPLLGRARELDAIVRLLLAAEPRLLTLTGPGGVGKTRLAEEAARRIAPHFADGVLFLRLDGVSDPALVFPSLAGALHVRESGRERSSRERIVARLAALDLLVVLDNFEHLLPAAVDLADLLRRVPRARVLATSRESLRIAEERVFAVAPLPRPGPAVWQAPAAPPLDHSPAIALFLCHAAAVRPDLATDPADPAGRANLTAIAEICYRLDGLPLAIELAAAQVEVFSPAALLTLLEDAGLPLLAGGQRDQPDRLRTMEAAIGWSYALLPEPEQRLFRALSVFAGGFTLAAAARVGGSDESTAIGAIDPRDELRASDAAAIAGIAALMRRNLVVEELVSDGPAAPRFRLLEPIRLFARDRLRKAGDEPAVRLRHAAYFAALSEGLDALTLGPEPELWLPRLERELANVRAAQDWALAAGETELAVRIACGVAQMWEIKGLLSEARQRVWAAMAFDAPAAPALRWFLRFWAGTFALDAGDEADAQEQAAALSEIAEEHEDAVGIGVGLALSSRAIGAEPDRHDEAAALAQRAVEMLEPLGHDEWTGWAWSRLGIELHRLGRLAAAHDALQRGLAVRRRRPCAGCVSYSLASLGAVLADLGQPTAARHAYLGCLDLAVRHENQTLSLAALVGLADVAWRYGAGQEAARVAALLFGAAEGIRQRHGIGRDEEVRSAIARWQAPLWRVLGEATADALAASGGETPLPGLLDRARNLHLALEPSAQAEQRSPALLLTLGSIE